MVEVVLNLSNIGRWKEYNATIKYNSIVRMPSKWGKTTLSRCLRALIDKKVDPQKLLRRGVEKGIITVRLGGKTYSLTVLSTSISGRTLELGEEVRSFADYLVVNIDSKVFLKILNDVPEDPVKILEERLLKPIENTLRKKKVDNKRRERSIEDIRALERELRELEAKIKELEKKEEEIEAQLKKKLAEKEEREAGEKKRRELARKLREIQLEIEKLEKEKEELEREEEEEGELDPGYLYNKLYRLENEVEEAKEKLDQVASELRELGEELQVLSQIVENLSRVEALVKMLKQASLPEEFINGIRNSRRLAEEQKDYIEYLVDEKRREKMKLEQRYNLLVAEAEKTKQMLERGKKREERLKEIIARLRKLKEEADNIKRVLGDTEEAGEEEEDEEIAGLRKALDEIGVKLAGLRKEYSDKKYQYEVSKRLLEFVGKEKPDEAGEEELEEKAETLKKALSEARKLYGKLLREYLGASGGEIPLKTLSESERYLFASIHSIVVANVLREAYGYSYYTVYDVPVWMDEKTFQRLVEMLREHGYNYIIFATRSISEA